MKRLFFLITALLLLLAGCANEKDGSTFSIRSIPTDQTDEGWALKASGAGITHLFEVKGKSKAKSASAWIDHYMHGKLVEGDIKIGSIDMMKDASFQKMYLNVFSLENDKQMWVFSFRDSAGIYTMRRFVTPIMKGSPGSFASGGDVRLGKPVDLSVFVYSEDHSKGMTLYTDVKRNIEAQDEVYVLRCQFD